MHGPFDVLGPSRLTSALTRQTQCVHGALKKSFKLNMRLGIKSKIIWIIINALSCYESQRELDYKVQALCYDDLILSAKLALRTVLARSSIKERVITFSRTSVEGGRGGGGFNSYVFSDLFFLFFIFYFFLQEKKSPFFLVPS